ncbi:aminoglycoside phosphotransferase family protein [Streptomyces sp. NPDC059398]|uniref:aminoglycoside phosphotransferase family protein n=1 Tax=Streptomyces sp. NPDC059398 TaxID=3346820 RepID=UPI0036A8408E
MHANEARTDESLVRSLLRGQFRHLAGLPIRRLASGGTTNAIYRVGTGATVRLPLLPGGVEALEREVRWLSRLAPSLPFPIPEVIGLGEPAEGYPHRWALHRWVAGEVLVEGCTDGQRTLARDLAAFVTALRGIDPEGGPRSYRGSPPVSVDTETRDAIDALRRTEEPFEPDALLAAWDSVLRVPHWTGRDQWSHSDLMPSNLLGADGRLTAVLDFGTVGVGDPAIDLIPAWNLLSPAGRSRFHDAVDVDEATWARGRGWALSMALIQLPYYRRTNPVIAANARHTIGQVLAAR